MNIFVCVKQVPDTETKIKLGPQGVDTNGIKWMMNPYDSHAVEEALKIKASTPGAIVTAMTVGPKARVTEVLVNAAAMGADEGVIIDAPELMDSGTVASALAKAIQQTGAPWLVLTGKLSIDLNQSSVGPMLAEKLGLPHASVVSKLEVTSESFTAERETEGGTKEIVQLQAPAVITANKGLNNPRYPSLPGIMKAKKKVFKELSLEQLGISEPTSLKYSDFQLPPERPPIKLMSGDAAAQVQQLVQLLREEAKVI